MRYAIVCLLCGEVEKYQHGLVNEIAERFDLHKTRKQSLATHFTLKYGFEADSIREVEILTGDFCNSQTKTLVRVGGFGNFASDVVFVDVHLSEEARITFLEYIVELKRTGWIEWGPYDGENLHFHAAIAEECGQRFDEVWKFVNGKDRKYFDCWFDNVTFLEQVGIVDNISRWEICRTFLMKE
jgi:hypothetical protein